MTRLPTNLAIAAILFAFASERAPAQDRPAPSTGGATFEQVQREFNQWLSVQKVYPRDQVPRLRTRFEQKARSLSGSALQNWLNEMDAKMQILGGPQAQGARQWLSYFASAQAALPNVNLQQFDIIDSTPAQIQQLLDRIDSRRQSRAQKSQAFSASRERQVQLAQQETQDRLRAERQANTNRSMESFFPGYQSPYAPQRNQPRPTLPKGPTIYTSPWGVGFILNN